MGIILVEAEVDKSGFSFVIPTGAWVTIPKFSRAGIEGDAIKRDAEKGMPDWGRLGSDFRMGWQMKVVILR